MYHPYAISKAIIVTNQVFIREMYGRVLCLYAIHTLPSTNATSSVNCVMIPPMIP